MNFLIPGSLLDDNLSGDSKFNILIGLAGNDLLIGNGGNDLLIGGRGMDTLTGGAGKDIVVGGRGADSFTIEANSDTTVIKDFEIGVDRLDFSSFNFASPLEEAAAGQISGLKDSLPGFSFSLRDTLYAALP